MAIVVWQSTKDMTSDMCTKVLDSTTYLKHKREALNEPEGDHQLANRCMVVRSRHTTTSSLSAPRKEAIRQTAQAKKAPSLCDTQT